MDAMTTPDFGKAAAFITANARVLDIRRFERLFAGGEAAPVRDAVAAYRNPDGGFGHALELDSRTPGSQPAAVAMALRVMNEADCWDEDLVRGACDWLEQATRRGRRGVRAADAQRRRVGAVVDTGGGTSGLADRHRNDHRPAARPPLQPPMAGPRDRGDVDPDRSAGRRGTL